MRRVARAQLESPQLAGLRLLPTFTPGRALMWGSILALWGTAAVVASSSRALGIQTVGNLWGKPHVENLLPSGVAPAVCKSA